MQSVFKISPTEKSATGLAGIETELKPIEGKIL